MEELEELVKGLERIDAQCDRTIIALQGNRALVTKVKRIHVHHDVPEHTEVCETMRIPTEYDYTDWNVELLAWQCQFCQRVHDRESGKFITEEEYKENHKYEL